MNIIVFSSVYHKVWGCAYCTKGLQTGAEHATTAGRERPVTPERVANTCRPFR